MLVHAQGVSERQCDCFCATKKGTKPPGSGEEMVSTSTEECKAKCKTQGDRVAVCAFAVDQYPSQDDSCFTQDECEKQVKAFCGDGSQSDAYSTIECDKDTRDTFGETQPPGCMPNSHFCYPPKNATKVRLNIAIGTTTVVNDIEKYVSILYQWLVTVGITFTIVLVMIGGLQYTLGGASSEQMKKGKDRIKNAVIGLILLLSSILIIETISPQLSRISVPRLPMIKTREIADSAKSCETLFTEEKFKIRWDESRQKNQKRYIPFNGKNNPRCGTIGEVVEGPGGVNVNAGLTCNFRDCGNPDRACLGSGWNARCLSCGQIYDGSTALIGSGVVPSASTCGQFTKGVTKGTSEMPDTIEQCGWTKDGDLNEGALGGGVFKVASNGACVNIVMDCSTIRKSGLCRNYHTVPLTNDAEGGEQLYSADSESDECFTFGSCANFSYKSICEENPCKIKGGCEIRGDGVCWNVGSSINYDPLLERP